jgi:hypothetical protein
MNRRRQQGKGKGLPPFVPVIREAFTSPAYRAMSHGAKSLYLSLMARYSNKSENNGWIFLPTRKAAEELGSGLEEIRNWFRELAHYGFIVMTAPGHLGSNGNGRAPRWRITALECKNVPATKEFLRWDGTKFQRRKRSSRKTESRVAFPSHPESEMLPTPVQQIHLSSQPK